MTDICLVSAARGSTFMAELLDVVADEIREQGGRARTVLGELPEPDPDTVYVIVPHEYLVITEDERYPTPEQCARTIGFCVEHPGTGTFERSAGLVGSLAGAVDINLDAAAELSRRGIPVEHYRLGYSPRRDVWGGTDTARDLDVVYLGTAEPRRSRLLASYAEDLAELRCRLLTPPHEMMNTDRPDFLSGGRKLELLAGSRFLLNLHRENKRQLEWVRALEAMSNGAVLVSEPSTDLDGLEPGEHLVLARPESLGTVLAAMAADPDRETRIRRSAYDFVRAIDSATSARTLMELADRVLDGRRCLGITGFADARGLAAALRSPVDALAVDTPSWDTRFVGDATTVPTAAGPPDPIDPTRGGHWCPSAPGELFAEVPEVSVDVLVVRCSGEPDPDELCGDLVRGSVRPARILVADDGFPLDPTPCSWDRLVFPDRVGRAAARNALFERSTAPLLLVLDGGTRVASRLLDRLMSVIGAADVAHCPVADPDVGLVGALPPESCRLRTVPYLGSVYLVRRAVVEAQGGWVSDPMFDGLVDHVFWRRLAASTRRSVLVQQVLARRERTTPPVRALDVDPVGVWSAVDSLG